MSETYYVESKKDERELISHISDFSVSLRSYIYTNMNSWMTESEEYPSNGILILKNRVHEIKKMELRHYLLNLLAYKAETLGDIKYLLKAAALQWNRLGLTQYDNNIYNPEIKKALEILLFDILCHKFDSYELASKIKRPNNNDYFGKFHYLREIMMNIKDNCCNNKDSYGRCLNNAIYMHLIFKTFGMNPLLFGTPFLSYFSCFDPKDKLDVCCKLEKISEKGDSYDVFKDIEQVRDYPSDKLTEHPAEENYDRKRIVKVGKGDMMIIGDDIFECYGEVPYDFLHQVKMIDKVTICEYHKRIVPDQITFDLSENDLSFLEYEYGYKKCMIKEVNSSKYFISVTIGNIPKIFLLYKNKKEKDKIYAISVFSVPNHYRNREILTFKKPSSSRYKIKTEGVGINK